MVGVVFWELEGGIGDEICGDEQMPCMKRMAFGERHTRGV